MQPESSPYGINVNQLSDVGGPITAQTHHTIGTLLRQANVAWLRVDSDRRLFGGASDIATQGEWGRVKETVRQSTCRGFNILGILSYSNGADIQRSVARARHTYMPDDITRWSAYVRAVVDSFPEVRYWAIWNEPNDTSYFNGYGWETSPAQTVGAYAALVDAAAPHIRGNTDARGRRFLVAPEVAAGQGSDAWLREVLVRQGHNIDVVAVHAYGDAAGIASYAGGLRGRLGLPSWPWPVWLTEAGPAGCNAGAANIRATLPYCESVNGSDRIFINDAFQASELSDLMVRMAGHWDKTFYWHSHTENVAVDIGNDYGVLHGARANALVGRPAFTGLSFWARGWPTASGAGYAYNASVPVEASPAVAASSYWAWEYRWCSSDVAETTCSNSADPASAWHPYGVEGQDRTVIYPYVFSTDRWVDVRASQYAWVGGPLIGRADWHISGAGECTGSDCGPWAQAAMGSGGETTKSGKPPRRYPTAAERRARNR